MREIDKAAVFVKENSQKLDEFIAQHDFFILKTASKTSKRYVSKNDDEYSIALYAFYDAVNKYDFDRGSFYTFAELLIQRNLVDYFRTQSKYNAEVQIEEIDIKEPCAQSDGQLRYEIESVRDILNRYGFDFMDLADCSPKAEKTKISCKIAVNFLLDNPCLINEMREKRQLPIKIIENNTYIPRKILERHRKYIIAAVEILNGEYTGIAQYLNCLREGVKSL
jgi:RNA polymerase sigma factor